MSTQQPPAGHNRGDENPVNPQAVEETKRQIRTLVSEIEELSRQEVEPAAFYGEFLQRVITALAAVGGAVWTVKKGAGLELAYQINIRNMFPDATDEDQQRHSKLLYRCLRNGEQLLVPPFSGAEGDDDAGNPTSYLLVLAPIMQNGETQGVIEIFQRPSAGPASQRGYLKFLVEMSQKAGDYLRAHRLRELSDWQTMYSEVEHFARGVHGSLDPRTTAYTIANEGRRLIGCDRVSVAIRKGRKCQVEAVSGQDSMDTRANSVMLLSKLATAVMRSGEPLWYTGDDSELPPQIEDAIHNYVDETHTKTVIVLPLMKPSDYVPDGDEAKRLQEEKEEVIGTLIVEQIEDNRAPEEFTQTVDLVCQHSCSAMANAMTHNRLFLMPVWRSIGNMAWVLQARTLPKTLAIAAAVIGFILFTIFFPKDFYMTADGKLEPKEQRAVIVGVPGDVVEVHKDTGDAVKANEKLLTLENIELNEKIIGINGEISKLKTLLENANRQKKNRNLDPQTKERARVDAISHEMDVKLKTLERDELERQKSKLDVLSPIDGVILDFKAKELLQDRPLNRGDQVFRIANPDGEWELDVKMEEDRLGNLIDAAEDHVDDTGNMQVEYILKSDPENKLEGLLNLKDIGDRAQTYEEHGHAVRMLVEIDEEKLRKFHQPKSGTEITVKVYCGKKPIGYVWFHELFGFLRQKFFLYM